MSKPHDPFEHHEQVAALLVDSVVDHAIFALDVDGTVRTWNPGARRLKGYSTEEIVGEHFSRFYLAEDRDDGLPGRLLAEAEREGRVEHRGWRLRSDGSRFWASVTITPLRADDGVLVGFAKVTRDLTHEREATEARRRALAQERETGQRLQRAQQARARLLAEVAHDLGTPLSLIRNGTEMLAEDGISDGAVRRQLLRRVRDNAQHVTRLSGHLTEFARLEGDAWEVTPVPVELEPAVTELVEDLATVHAGIELHVAVDGAAVVEVDPLSLRRVLTNLVDNAARFSPAGGDVHLRVRDGDGEVVISVSDEGPGVPEEIREAVFDGFWRGPGDDEHPAGLGLGLSIVRRHVELHGGRAWVDSSRGDGATFHVAWPTAGERERVADGPATAAGEGTAARADDRGVATGDQTAPVGPQPWLEVGPSAVGAVLEGMRDAAVLLANDPDAGHPVVAGNAAMRTWLGSADDELAGRPLSGLLPADAAHEFERHVRTAVEQAQPVSYDLTRTSATGPEAWRMRLLPVAAVGTDACTHLVMVAHDRTDEHRAQQALDETEALANLGHWVWLIGPDTVEWSDQLYRIWGVERDSFEATYEAYVSMVHPDDQEDVAARIQESFTGGQPFEFDHRIVRPDGDVRWIHSTGRTYADGDGHPVRMSGTAQDIDERKELEAARRAAERASERQEQALELNDDVMQRLSSAWLALDVGDLDTGTQHLERGLSSLRRVISELLATDEDPDRMQPGRLVRTSPSTPDRETDA